MADLFRRATREGICTDSSVASRERGSVCRNGKRRVGMIRTRRPDHSQPSVTRSVLDDKRVLHGAKR